LLVNLLVVRANPASVNERRTQSNDKIGRHPKPAPSPALISGAGLARTDVDYDGLMVLISRA